MKTFTPTKAVHDLIFETYLTELPIGGGTGSKDDPIIMLVDENYVHNEYEVLEFLGYYRDVEWERNGQILRCKGNRYIDCLTISVICLANGYNEGWTEEYYFDVTVCIAIN